MPATFTVEELTLDVINALKFRLPGFSRMGRDLRADRLKLDQTYKAKIVGVPDVSDVDMANGGYRANATDARTLLTDLPITVDKHKKASLSFAHLDSIKDNNQQYERLVGNTGYALAKHVTLDIASKLTSRNLSHHTKETIANTDYETLNGIRDAMNQLGNSGMNRTGIVNTAVASALGLDTRQASRDYRDGMGETDMAYRTFRNIAGFEEVIEFPILPSNNGSAVAITAEADDNVITTASAHGLIVGDPVSFTSLAGGAGLADDGTVYYVASVPSTTTLTVSATDGGSAVDITTDYTGGSIGTAENLTGVFFEPEAISVLAGIPEDMDTFAVEVLGAPKPYRDFTVTDPESGLTMVAIAEVEGGTLKGYLHFTLVWGCAVGKQGGADSALTDDYGHRLISA